MWCLMVVLHNLCGIFMGCLKATRNTNRGKQGLPVLLERRIILRWEWPQEWWVPILQLYSMLCSKIYC